MHYFISYIVNIIHFMRETWVRSLGHEDPLEKKMAPHSSTIAWKIPWTEEPGRLQSMGSQRVGHDWATPLSYNKYMQTKYHGVSKYTIWTAYVVLSRISCIITIFWINIQILKFFLHEKSNWSCCIKKLYYLSNRFWKLNIKRK